MNFLRISPSDISYSKGKITYLHDGKDIGSGAFELKEKATLRILLPRFVGAVSVCLSIYSESLSLISEEKLELADFDYQNDTYLLDVSALSLPTGLYFMRLQLDTPAGVLYGVKGKATEIIFKERDEGNSFQFSLVDFKYPFPDKYIGGTIYHVFVDRFFRSGNGPVREDAIIIEDWDNGIPEYPEYPGAHLENNTFFGGTLFGVAEKLDYIKSLGVNLIYLSPVFEAYSNHKYDTGDYMRVDAMFGGDEALKMLIQEAESRDIGIILDGVFNHTGSDSIYFNRRGRYGNIGAYQSKSSPYYNWYDFQSFPEKYTCWWGIEILPRINPDVKECGDFLAGNGGVIEKYAKMGIAGFRLDVADELSDNFIKRIKSTLSKSDAPTLLYGEVWEDASNKIAYDTRKKYYLGDELDGVMNYPLRVGIIDFLKKGNCSALEYALTDVMFNAPKRIRDMQMNLLGTHDTERIITILSGDSSEGKSNRELSTLYLTEEQRNTGRALVKLAYTILATLPGLPTVFYGDEVGLEGYKDPFNRRPYPWNNPDAEIRNFYIKIGNIRSTSFVFGDGDFRLIHIDNKLLIFERSKGGKSYITAVNNSDTAVTLKFEKRVKALLTELNTQSVKLGAKSAEIIKTVEFNNIEIILNSGVPR